MMYSQVRVDYLFRMRTIGRGAVVTAGSVVSSSVRPMTVVQGNPARPIATWWGTLGEKTTMGQFLAA